MEAHSLWSPMSTKTPPENGSGFGDLEDDFFNSTASWDAPEPVIAPPPPKPAKGKAKPQVEEEELTLAERLMAQAEAEARAAAARASSGEAPAAPPVDEPRVFPMLPAEPDTTDILPVEGTAEVTLTGVSMAIIDPSTLPVPLPDEHTEVVLPPADETDAVPAPPSATPEPVAAAPQVAEPPTGEAEVQDVDGDLPEGVRTLLRRARASEGDVRAELFLQAVRVGEMQDVPASRRFGWLDEGGRPTVNPVAWMRERARVATAMGRMDRLRDALAGLGMGAQGIAAAEALVQASELSRRLGQAPGAVMLATQAVARSPGWVPALLAALDIQPADAPAALPLLDALGEALPGVAGAAARRRRARALGAGDDAIAAWQGARAAEPGSLEAFVGLAGALKAAGHTQALAELLADEAARVRGVTPTDAALLLGRAATLWYELEPNGVRAMATLTAALEADPACEPVRRALEALCVRTNREDMLLASARDEATALGADAPSWLAWRVGHLAERRANDPANAPEVRSAAAEEALTWYRRASEDASAAPAAEGVLRILQGQKRWQEIVDFLDARLERLADPSVMVTVLYRMGETCEGPLDDPQRARVHYERVLDVAPGYLPALEGLERVCSRTQAWPALAAVYEQRALLADRPGQVALHRQRAGSVYEVRMEDLPRAREQYRLALEAVPDFAPSLDAYTRSLAELGDWVTLAQVLRNAANVTRDANEAVSLYYRAARVLADRTTELAMASECIDRCLALSPGFLPAVLLAKDLSGAARGWDAYAQFERMQADAGESGERRAWHLFAAASALATMRPDETRQYVYEILGQDVRHGGAAALAQQVALQEGGAAAEELYGRLSDSGAGAAPLWRARAVELAAERGDATRVGEFVKGGTVAAPRWVAGHALAVGASELAVTLLESAGEHAGLDALRVRAAREGVTPRVADAVAEGVARGEAGFAALAVELRTSVAAQGYGLLADAGDPSSRAGLLYAAALCAEAADGEADAQARWASAFEAMPTPGRAFERVLSAAANAQDAASVRAAYGRLGDDMSVGFARDLSAAGDLDGALALLRERLHAAPGDLATLVEVEALLEGAGRWSELFAALQARMAVTRDEVEADAIGARCRWVLAEKLAETDEAWDFYRQLHETRPGDRDVLEALARIAGARGEGNLAIGYFEQLAATASAPADAARIQRRVAELRERDGDHEGARAALTRALDVAPEDAEALSGLRRLAELAQDWSARVGVLSRQAALATGAARVELLVETARTWDVHVGDRHVAVDAWRKVLDLSPEHREALGRLVALNESLADWSTFVAHAEMLVRVLDGAERSALQARVGQVLVRELQRDDEAVRWLEAAVSGEPTDAAAAELLEGIHVGRSAWDKAIDVLTRRARASAPADAVPLLERAARLALDSARDRGLAAGVYSALLTVAPDHADALRFEADARFESGDMAAALPLLERLETHEAARDTEDFDTQVEVATYFYRYAEALRRLGRENEARARFERALDLSPAHLPSLEAVGPLYMRAAEWRAAEKVYQKLLQLTGGLGDAEQLARLYTSLGRVELRLGSVDKARKRLVKALELRPNDVASLRGYAEVLIAAEDWNQLLGTYNNIIYHTQDPADVIEAYIRKGYVLDAKMDLAPRAAQHYEKSLAFEPAQPEALVRLAELALRRDDPSEALSLAERGLAVETVAPAVRACLLLARAIASEAAGDARGAEESLAEVRGQDATLADAIASQSADTLRALLRTRLTSSIVL